MDILHVQKVIRYFQFLEQKNEISFSTFHLGGVSYELEENLQTLCESGLVDRIRGKFDLTDEGKRAVDELRAKYDAEDLRKLAYSKQLLNDLTADELMFFMYKLLPETQVNSTEVNRLFKRSRELTVSLFRKGRLSAAMAAKWLDTTEPSFIESLSKGK